MPAIGFFRGFCDFCDTSDGDTKINEYKQPPGQETEVIFLCDLCAQLSPNLRKQYPFLAHVFYGQNMILKKLTGE